MKLVRFETEAGKVHQGRLEEGEILEISGDILSDYNVSEKSHSLDEVQLLAPVFPPNIIAIGLNYFGHAEELGSSIPDEPLMFMKATSSILPPEKPIELPAAAPKKVDYEAELGIVIGEKTSDVQPENAGKAILGFTCVNDVTARDCQEDDGQWIRAKSFDTFCPAGPWIETELEEGGSEIRSYVNGEIRQQSNTKDMIFDPEQLVSYCSKMMTLLPGTLILTGTPAGVGKSFSPPRYLKSGDEVKIEIEGLGQLVNSVR
ncbi:fumarylacetoacetate hydrolase family protein [Halarsenatibacter silvermanii]|uniref:2-keto-4-pentenoate hydratase/2-oxohepta-3-ene-1,7-dioic acid hydratase (Catechol pathway) n=1 Tax=Halarsenatibacter silvermanii TaxID=321763 RepID=A0A1G9PRC3_9FIRM|nr:fumarylacetoacetate hydrolase family protein [Halarsenatibacter silvermanii]SDM01304.1 2-keto-4-pentenoate hydratase/2-oxohepta-3-ene-1,7-dioic acid hydratase (catechol pathway) [Halarsenatibacter silvermanii]